jgi:hypothetical protein
MLQRISEQITECLRRAAEAQDRADEASDAELKADYERMAETWRALARSYEFQGSLGRFISFNNEGRNAALPILVVEDDRPFSSSAGFAEKEADFFDRLARISGRIQPYTIDAFGIALATVSVATLLRFIAG